MQLLRHLQGESSPPGGERRLVSPPTIVLTGHGSTQAAVEAMKLGAWDYLVKPCNPDELLMTIEQVLRVSDLERENRRLREVDRALAGLRRDHRTEPGDARDLPARSRRWRRTRPRSSSPARAAPARSWWRAASIPAGRARRAAVRRAQLRRGLRHPARQPALRPSPRRVHRRRRRPRRASSRRRTAARSSSTRSPTSRAALQVKFLRAIQEREVTPLGTTRADQGRRAARSPPPIATSPPRCRPGTSAPISTID